MNLGINMVETCRDTPECLMGGAIRQAMKEDNYLNALTAYMINGWQTNGPEVKDEIPMYWPFCDDMVMINGIVIKGRRIVIPIFLRQRAFEQLHINHMGTEKIRLLARESLYSVYINAAIENAIKMHNIS